MEGLQATNAEIPTCFGCIANPLGVPKHFKFALNAVFFGRHENFLHLKLDKF